MYRLLFRLWLRHYQGKLAVAKAVERSDTNPVLLIPSNFMQNDDMFLDDNRRRGVLPAARGREPGGPP
jgi:hypothetical protein